MWVCTDHPTPTTGSRACCVVVNVTIQSVRLYSTLDWTKVELVEVNSLPEPYICTANNRAAFLANGFTPKSSVHIFGYMANPLNLEPCKSWTWEKTKVDPSYHGVVATVTAPCSSVDSETRHFWCDLAKQVLESKRERKISEWAWKLWVTKRQTRQER